MTRIYFCAICKKPIPMETWQDGSSSPASRYWYIPGFPQDMTATEIYCGPTCSLHAHNGRVNTQNGLV